MKNKQNFKGTTQNEEHIAESGSLKDRILAMPNDSVLFRSDFPDYHSEFVGSVLAELTNEGVLVKMNKPIKLDIWRTFTNTTMSSLQIKVKQGE